MSARPIIPANVHLRERSSAARKSDRLLGLKHLIVSTLHLDGVRPEEIPDDDPLIGSSRLGIDSIDALELALALEKRFGVKIGSSEESRRALGSVNTLAAFLRSRPPGA